MVAGALRRRVGVGQVDALSRQRHVARDTFLVDGHVGRRRRAAARVCRGQRDRVVLGKLEAEPPRFPVRLLDEVDRPGVAVGDGARVGEDEREEGVDIALGREPDADFVELFELAPRLLGLALHPNVVEGVRQRAGKNGLADGLCQALVPVRWQRHTVGRRGRERDHRNDAFAACGDDGPGRVGVRVDDEHGLFGRRERGRRAGAHGSANELRGQACHEFGRRRAFEEERDARLHEVRLGSAFVAVKEASALA